MSIVETSNSPYALVKVASSTNFSFRNVRIDSCIEQNRHEQGSVEHSEPQIAFSKGALSPFILFGNRIMTKLSMTNKHWNGLLIRHLAFGISSRHFFKILHPAFLAGKSPVGSSEDTHLSRAEPAARMITSSHFIVPSGLWSMMSKRSA